MKTTGFDESSLLQKYQRSNVGGVWVKFADLNKSRVWLAKQRKERKPMVIALPMQGALHDAIPHVIVFTPDTSVLTRPRQSMME